MGKLWQTSIGSCTTSWLARVTPLLLALLLMDFGNGFAAAKYRTTGAVRNQRGIGINSDKLALPGVVVIKLKPGIVATVQELFKVPELEGRILKEASPQSVESIIQAARIRFDKSSQILDNIYVVKYSGMVTPAMVAQTILKNPDVVYAEPHYIYRVDFTPNDSLLSAQYALSKIQAFQAWDITQGSSNVIVGIVDTGVDWMHPDLYGNIWHNPHWQTDTQYQADSIGWDFGGKGAVSNNSYVPTPDNDPAEDSPAHGTHVAGIVAAIANNKIGIAGVAPGCGIMPVKVSQANYTDPSGEPYIVYGFEGIAYAANNGARIINCSWGGPGYSQYEQDVINFATGEGSLVVAAAGNDSHSTEFFTPAYYDNVLSVAATDQNDNATYFTNVSYNISVSAPGLGIMSTWGTDQYTSLSGTSMASPCVAGVAALVVSQHPEYTAQQVSEQVRVSADNIDAINPTFVHQIGFGRVNAYRALTVTSPGVEISNMVLSDSVYGNNDGTFTDGETVQLLGVLTDWLAPTTNLQVTLTSDDPYVTIVNGNASIGALTTKGTYDLEKNPLSFKVKTGTPAGHVAEFLMLMQDGSYSDYKGFSVMLNPTFNQLSLNNIATTITAQGNIGFNDYPNNIEGTGFIYKPDDDSLLFEGAFMAGTSSFHEVDVARDSSGLEESGDFRREGLVQVKTPGTIADQEAATTFNDSNATFNKVGIEVSLHTYSYTRDSTGNFVILEYRINNLTSSPISNFYGGIFLDWDISPYQDIADYDGSYHLGYAYDSSHGKKTYAGCALIYGANANYTAIDNNAAATGANTGFNKLRKWNALTGETGITRVGPADISMVISGGPVSIQPNSDTILTFALVAGDTLSDLESAVRVAKEVYETETHIVQPPLIPTLARLNQNYPNPFNPTTHVTFDLSEDAKVTINVFNVLGQKVATLTDQDYRRGSSSSRSPLTFSTTNLASGVYLLQLKAVSATQTYIQTKKMTLLK